MHELALFYVGKFATTRAKLTAYLNRKLRERGWEGGDAPDVERLVERLTASGLIDDALYAQSKARSLTERGYGMARVRQSLRAAGINETDGTGAQELAAEGAADAALRFARRRRLGDVRRRHRGVLGRREGLPGRSDRSRGLARPHGA